MRFYFAIAAILAASPAMAQDLKPALDADRVTVTNVQSQIIGRWYNQILNDQAVIKDLEGKLTEVTKDRDAQKKRADDLQAGKKEEP